MNLVNIMNIGVRTLLILSGSCVWLYAACERDKVGTKAPKASSDLAYTINGTAVTLTAAQAARPAPHFDLERRRYEILREQATDAYLDSYFSDLGKPTGTSPEQAKAQYISASSSVSDEEVKAAMSRIGGSPAFVLLTETQKITKVRELIADGKAQQAKQKLIDDAIRDKKIIIHVPMPTEPIYALAIDQDDFVRAGSKASDTTAGTGCRGDDCAITIVEYCDLASRSCAQMAAVSQALTDKYSGKIRWIFRSFVQPNVAESRQAAHAAICAGRQKKFWSYYDRLTSGVIAMSGTDGAARPASDRVPASAKLDELSARDAGLDLAAFATCRASDAEVTPLLERQATVARNFGVSGTPTIYINGKRMSGLVPRQVLEQRIDEILQKK